MITDDYGYECHETRLLPLGGGANIICSRRGFDREIAFRKKRNSSRVNPVATPFLFPAWEDLEVYQTEDDTK